MAFQGISERLINGSSTMNMKVNEIQLNVDDGDQVTNSDIINATKEIQFMSVPIGIKVMSITDGELTQYLIVKKEWTQDSPVEVNQRLRNAMLIIISLSVAFNILESWMKFDKEILFDYMEIIRWSYMLILALLGLDYINKEMGELRIQHLLVSSVTIRYLRLLFCLTSMMKLLQHIIKSQGRGQTDIFIYLATRAISGFSCLFEFNEFYERLSGETRSSKRMKEPTFPLAVKLSEMVSTVVFQLYLAVNTGANVEEIIFGLVSLMNILLFMLTRDRMYMELASVETDFLHLSLNHSSVIKVIAWSISRTQ